MFITALCVIFLSTTKIIGYYKMNFFFTTTSFPGLLSPIPFRWKCPSYPVQTPLKSWLFQVPLHNCLNCVHNCDDHSLLDFKIHSSIYEIFIYHLTQVTLSTIWSSGCTDSPVTRAFHASGKRQPTLTEWGVHVFMEWDAWSETRALSLTIGNDWFVLPLSILNRRGLTIVILTN